jgi:nucleoside recognition membrane protein YjiH
MFLVFDLWFVNFGMLLLVFGCWLLVGCWLVVGCWLLVVILGFVFVGCWCLVFGSEIYVLEPKTKTTNHQPTTKHQQPKTNHLTPKTQN